MPELFGFGTLETEVRDMRELRWPRDAARDERLFGISDSQEVEPLCDADGKRVWRVPTGKYLFVSAREGNIRGYFIEVSEVITTEPVRRKRDLPRWCRREFKGYRVAA